MNAQDVVAAIRYGRPGEQFGYGGDGSTFDDLVWSGTDPAPTLDDVKAWSLRVDALATTPKAPPAANAVLGALAALDPATASVADVVNAVKSALAKAGATAV